MQIIILFIHLMITLALIFTVLIQRSEHGGMGVGAGSRIDSFMSARSSANVLTKITTILAACFMATSLTLAIIAFQAKKSYIVDQIIDNKAFMNSSSPAAPFSQ
ncbi:Protein translocase SecG [Candidatus Endolissoclinum faulkneri L2]|uniref:Protein-export membrane protein SecG n=1 Tax=Candidatus Endolissoclinum faulkneri L2 TaxID=1193729 RepID=K7Z478_9PROT|nr:preprotein translocase subunit SecG [Candidatus Endolissoclinum faulkneri]AFX98818.1 Protein translocase SecG [Candidatus Endolissoclinum faulkneri L2]